MRRGIRGCAAALLCWVWLATLHTGCATLGGIPPTTFQFYNVVPYQKPGEGGWKVAQVSIRLTWRARHKTVESWCDVEVGVPERNHLGTVPNTEAQETAADAADQAAYHVLRIRNPRPATSAEFCRAFRQEMQRLMNLSIPGAKVDPFQRAGIPRTTFASSVPE